MCDLHTYRTKKVYYTVMCGLTRGYIIRNASLGYYLCEFTYTNLDGIVYYKPRLYGIQSTAPSLRTCIARYCTKQCNIKSSTRVNDAMKRCNKHETIAGITWHTILQQKVERITLK